MKNRNRRLLSIDLLLPAEASAADPVAPARLQAQPVELSVSPAEQPSPALRYRLLPISSELNPGDAAPIYLRLRHELDEEAWKQIQEKHDAWNAVPLEKLPSRRPGSSWTSGAARLSSLRIGTRRQFCDWSYPLAEQRQEMIEILLPDCQSMRQWARLLQSRPGSRRPSTPTTRRSIRSRPASPSAGTSARGRS